MRPWLALLLVLTACGGAGRGGGTAAPVTSTSAPTASSAVPSTASTPPPAPASTTSTTEPWPFGQRPLPLGPDGKPLPQETPPQLRERRRTAPDVLPPPADGAFHATIEPISPAVRGRMGDTWKPECPVGLDDLRHLTVSFRGFDGAAHTGELVVAASVADDVVSVFRRLFAIGFPIEEMRLPGTADVQAAPTGDGNDTAAYNCRLTRGSTTTSAHALGVAIDVNPFQNPYVKGDVVLPELARAYTDRERDLPGMIRAGDQVTKAFAAVGWRWGGAYTSLKDTMHFSANGR